MTSPTDAPASAYARQQRPEPLVLEAPDLGSDGWIPKETGWALDQLAADHARLLEQMRETDREVRSIRERFADEDTAYENAVRQGFREGVEVEAPSLTSPEDRREEIEAAEKNHALASEAFMDFLPDAIKEIEAGAPGWIGELADVHEDARIKREEAARLLAEATSEVERVGRLEEWLKRNSGTHERGAFRLTATRFVGWDFICENFSPLAPGVPDAAAVPHDAEAFAENLNRGVSRPLPAVDPRSETELLEDAHGVEPVDPQAALDRRKKIEQVAEEVDARAWNPGNSQEAGS